MNKKTITTKEMPVGVQEYIDKISGELVPCKITKLIEKDYNFHKVWMTNLISSLEDIANQKTKVAYWILMHLNRENKLLYTQQEISAATGASIQTVNIVIKSLINADLIRQIGGGIYIVNPNTYFKGTTKARQTTACCYNAVAKKQEYDEEMLQALQAQIAKLEKRAELIKSKTNKHSTPVT
ncbi:replication protein (RepL) [Pseudobutyrivibrio sp. 49]|uniref:replication/maintenance protein RepL n=1 Tax=Pseudobutyrivibrio sp. 49 TaxID=1855344 RepID=UPI0008843305|nr:replication/maintenance protein RepL [Pseudobutyrivibrio sp. 49]SDI51484.1 replication protein (RepL) [Pseudobutyrivibrio sp. 49]